MSASDDKREFHSAHQRSLEALGRRNRLRTLVRQSGKDFSSNDYLGLSASDELRAAVGDALTRGVAIGSGGSRLLRGNDPEHTKLEEEAARFFGSEAALYFSSGFSANAALLATLPQRGDLVVHDALVHASAHDGMRLTRAEVLSARHNDAQAFSDAIQKWRQAGGVGRPWLAVESLFSMDGDVAPLDELMAIADCNDGILLIDEAHSTGVLGPVGRGLGAHLEGRPNVVTLHTCGKALGAMGGLICGPRVLIEFLINRCRPFIYSTAPSPLMAATVRAALRLCAHEGEEGGGGRRARHRHLVSRAGAHLKERCGIKATGTHIQPVVVGSDEQAVSIAQRLQSRGFDIRAIRPPTVPEGTARLRMSLTLNICEDDALELADALAFELEHVR